ncbi:MAG: hypothetical protein M5T61_21225 [Acidimicrobiia bacterium]|nr:hypothetical protein [Acidimicrobiia bacterium]
MCERRPGAKTADIGIAIGAGTDVAIETARVELMRSDPEDVLRAIEPSKAMVRKMCRICPASVTTSRRPVAAGVFTLNWGIMLRPGVVGAADEISSIIVATNAVLLKRVECNLGAERSTTAPPASSRSGSPLADPVDARDVRSRGAWAPACRTSNDQRPPKPEDTGPALVPEQHLAQPIAS